MAYWGLTLEDVADDNACVEVWPDIWPVVVLFTALTTQWRIGPAGPTGLDYSALPFVMRMHGIARDKWPDTLDALRVMEIEALDIMREKAHG